MNNNETPSDILPDWDARLDAAIQEDDWHDAAHIILRALEVTGLTESMQRILQAKYLWLVKDAYQRGLWPEMDTYDTFANWVRGYYERTPYGKKLATVAGMVALWEFYHVRLGKSVEWLAGCGKAKLERMLATAKRTLTDEGELDADVEAALADRAVGFADVMDTYKSRAGLPITEPDDEEVSYRLLTRPGDGRPPGTLERWQDGIADDIGVLDVTHQEEAVMEFCAKVGVRVV